MESFQGVQIMGVDETSLRRECPQARYTGIALEYGTPPMEQVTAALRAKQWLELHPETEATTRTAIKRQFRDAFYTDAKAWKAGIVE